MELFASAEDIDAGMVLGCNHPMGPLALCDPIGLDTTAVAVTVREFKNSLCPHPAQSDVRCRITWRKKGRGHRYN